MLVRGDALVGLLVDHRRNFKPEKVWFLASKMRISFRIGRTNNQYSREFLLWKFTIVCVKYGLFGFLSYGYPDGVSLRERVVLLREGELLLVGVGLAVVDAEVEDPLLLSLPNKRE